MKNILVPTDFSEYAVAASHIALKMAKLAGARVHFLHIITTPVDWVKLDKSKESLYPETLAKIHHADSELKKLVRLAGKEKVEAYESLVYNMGREEILFHLKNKTHDFLVIGARGISGSRELLIGSNAQKIVRESPVPVLTVKNTNFQFPFKNIVFASNFEEDVYEPFQKVDELAKLMEAKLHFLYVNTPYSFEESDFSYQKMAKFVQGCHSAEKCTRNIFNAEDEERGILKFAEENNLDLIGLTTHGKKGLMNIISRSITESIVNHSEIPVLSLNMNME